MAGPSVNNSTVVNVPAAKRRRRVRRQLQKLQKLPLAKFEDLPTELHKEIVTLVDDI